MLRDMGVGTSITTLAKKIETGTQAKHRRVHARQITRLCRVRAVVSIDAFPYNGPGTSNGARQAGRDRVLHAFACRMSASRRKKGRKTLTFLVQRLLDDQTVEGLSEEAGGRLSGRK